MSSPPATIINAPMPVSALALYPQGMGSFIPVSVSVYWPCISQTGKINQTVRAITMPRKKSRAAIPLSIVSDVMIKKTPKYYIYLSHHIPTFQ
jgi:hypothetical protein